MQEYLSLDWVTLLMTNVDSSCQNHRTIGQETSGSNLLVSLKSVGLSSWSVAGTEIFAVEVRVAREDRAEAVWIASAFSKIIG